MLNESGELRILEGEGAFGGNPMPFRARVYVQRQGQTDASYLGEIDLDVRPILNGRASFMHEGQIIVGRVDTLVPIDWAEKGVIPTIHVVQR